MDTTASTRRIREAADDRGRRRRTAAVGASFAVLLSVLTVIGVVPGLAPVEPAAAAPGTVIRVDNTHAGGCGFLDAIRAANTNEVVGGCPAGTTDQDVLVLSGDVSLNTSPPAITDDLRIRGGGHTIHGGDRHRGLQVTGEGVEVIVEDLAIVDMVLGGGAPTRCYDPYEGCWIDPVGGSALAVTDGATVTLDRVRIEGNSVTGSRGRTNTGPAWYEAQPGGRGGAALGAVYVDGATLTVRRSLIVDNRATGGTGGTGQPGRDGTSGAAGDCQDGVGGADLPGPGWAGNYGGHGGIGGDAVAGLHAHDSTVTIEQTTFTGNAATGGEGGVGGAGGSGGAGGPALACYQWVGPKVVRVVYPAGPSGSDGWAGRPGSVGSAHGALLVTGDGTTVVDTSTIERNRQTVPAHSEGEDGVFYPIPVNNESTPSWKRQHSPMETEQILARSAAVAGGDGLVIRSSTIVDNETSLPDVTGAEDDIALDEPGLGALEPGVTIEATIVGHNGLTTDGTPTVPVCVEGLAFEDLGRSGISRLACGELGPFSDPLTSLSARTLTRANYTVAGIDADEAWLPVHPPSPGSALLRQNNRCDSPDVRGAIRRSDGCAAGSAEPVSDAQALPNQAPTALPVPMQTVTGRDSSDEDDDGRRAVRIGVSDLFEDLDTGTANLTVTEVGDPEDGSDVLASHMRGLSFTVLTLNPDAYGVVSFDLLATDPSGATAANRLSVLVAHEGRTEVNDDRYRTSPDTVLRAASFMTNDRLNVRASFDGLSSEPEHGEIDVAEDGTFTYTPDPGFRGIDTFSYRIATFAWPYGYVDYGTVTIDVGDIPLAIDDDYTTSEDERLVVDDVADGVLAEDDPVGSTVDLGAILHGEPSHGEIDLHEDGTFTYEPDADFVGTDTFTYQAVGDTYPSDPATVTVTVTPVNDAPRGVADSYVTLQNEILVVDATAGLFTNDVDLEGDAFELVSIEQPEHGSVVTSADDGSFTYHPEQNWSGTDRFTYLITDGEATSEPVPVEIEVVEGDLGAPPIAVDDQYQTPQGVPLVISQDSRNGVLSNDSDPDSTVLSAELRTRPEHGSLYFDSYGAFRYQPDLDFHGTDTFTYCARDGNACRSAPATVTITVLEGEVVPIPYPESYEMGQGELLTVLAPGLLGNDLGRSGEPLYAELVRMPRHGLIDVDEIDDQGRFTGGFRYLPSPIFWGRDSFTYRVHQGDQVSEPIQVGVEVLPAERDDNTAPVAEDDTYQTRADVRLSPSVLEGVLANDHDAEGDFLRAELVSSTPGLGLSLDDDGTFTYRHPDQVPGTATFTYRVTDGLAWSEPATVTIERVANSAPVAADDRYVVSAAETLTVEAPGLLANDTDENGDSLTVASHDDPASGTLSLNQDGSFEYVPAADDRGEITFTYVASDAGAESEPATVTIEVIGENHAPTGVGDTYAGRTDEVLEVDAADGVLANDVDTDSDELTAVLERVPEGLVDLHPDGGFTYWPPVDFEGTDEFTYVASDGRATSAPVTVTIDVDGSNRAPVGVDDGYSVLVGGSLEVAAPGVAGNDRDPDGDDLTVTVEVGPSNGTAVLGADGALTYEPDDGFVGTDTLTYRLSDGELSSGPVTVSIEVAEVVLHAEPSSTSVGVGEPITTIELVTEMAEGALLAEDGVAPVGTRAVGDVTLTATGLPDGLTLTDRGDGTGSISGSPTVIGSFTIEITAAVEGGPSARVEVRIEVVASTPVLNGIPAEVQPAQVLAAEATGFTPGETVVFRIEVSEGEGLVVVGSGTADEDGTVATELIVPTAPDGPVTFIAGGNITPEPAVASSLLQAPTSDTTTTTAPSTTVPATTPSTTVPTTTAPTTTAPTTTVTTTPSTTNPSAPPTTEDRSSGGVGSSVGDASASGGVDAGFADVDDDGTGTGAADGSLPGTGSDALTPALVGAALLAAGMVVFGLRRRLRFDGR